MARKIRFPLKMTNGAEVRTLDELRDNFDLSAVLGYYADGKLVTWLRDRYLDSEADKVEALDKNSKSFKNDFCAALGIEISSDSDEEGKFDEEYIKRRNEKRRLLRDITYDEKILRSVDSAAFNQDDLYDIYDEGKKEIYLCQGEFEIPLSVTDVTYIGVGNPTVKLRNGDKANFEKANIKFINCGGDACETANIKSINCGGDACETANIKSINCGGDACETTNIKSINCGGEKCEIDKDVADFVGTDEAKQLLIKAKQGDAESQYNLGVRYQYGRGVKKDEIKAFEWYMKAAENGNALARYKLENGWGVKVGENKAFMRYMKAAENGNPAAQFQVGWCYEFGCYGVKEDKNKAIKWYKKAAKNDNEDAERALERLGVNY